MQDSQHKCFFFAVSNSGRRTSPWTVSRGGLVRIAPIQFAQPVCALFFASAFLNGPLSPVLLLVAASIIVGTVTACRSARQDSTIKKRDLTELSFLEDHHWCRRILRA
jgi:hypothetical protein